MDKKYFISLCSYLTIIILILSSNTSIAQDKTFLADLVIVKGDTLPSFNLQEITVVPQFEFKSKKQKKKYTRLVRYVKKVYPYAKLANEKLKKLYSEIDSIDEKKVVKQHIKQVDRELREEYGDELKKLTITQGRILIKLIDRETGNTSYELIKELRGGFSAFMWQSLARLFGENLKSEYDPEEDDKMIEHIVLMIENGQL